MAGLFELLGFLPLEYQRAAVEAGGASFPISHRTHSAENAPPIHIVAVDQPLDERGPARPDSSRSGPGLPQPLRGPLGCGHQRSQTPTLARQCTAFQAYVLGVRPSGHDRRATSTVSLSFSTACFTRRASPSNGVEPHECLLEGYYTQGIEEGGRVREKLRDGVKSALEVLGTTLVEHPRNDVLRDRLRSGRLDEASYYRQLLNFVYRMLFLMVTEERKLLSTGADHERQTIYDRYYSISRLPRPRGTVFCR